VDAATAATSTESVSTAVSENPKTGAAPASIKAPAKQRCFFMIVNQDCVKGLKDDFVSAYYTYLLMLLQVFVLIF
jgi:hypothetical protein